MSFTISADDPRTIHAIELAAGAGQWIVCRMPSGEDAYGMPSQSDPERYYLVTASNCDCADFRRNGLSPERLGTAGEHRPCKHILAVRLHSELMRAERRHVPHRKRHRNADAHDAASRGHLRLLPSTWDQTSASS
ncbi:MAG: hypothetical protein NVSMB2_05310 [Chloroflexota bacterium]